MDPLGCQNPVLSINRNCGNVTDSFKNIWNNCNISVPNEKRQVLEWLSPLASRERHQAVRGTRVDGVGDWLLSNRTFFTWRASEDPAVKPVLFCHGDPGVGKTFINSLVIDTLSEDIDGGGVAVAYVYCDFSARNVQSAGTVLGSVLRQVLGALAEVPNEVQEAFERAKKQVDGCGLLLPEILDMLTMYLPSLERVFICIDALDEFPTPHRAQLWNSLKRVVRECPNTRLFLTGRSLIRAEVESWFPEDSYMVTVNPTLADLRRYIEKRLEENLDTSAMNDKLRADILRVVPERVSGIFLLACINMDAILAAPTIHQKRQALSGMTKGFDLQDAFGTTLDRIKQQSGNKSKLGMEALMWISNCERPLKPEELRHALGVELGVDDFNTHNVPSVRTILDCTLGLVIIDEMASTVRLLHHTLQEYLGEHPTLFVTARSMMAEICLTYMDYRSTRALSSGLGVALATMPFLEYATCFWGAHAASGVTETVKALALRVLDRYENHVSADILWRKKIRNSYWDEEVRGISGLHYIAFWGIVEITIAMLEAKKWDVNGCDSMGDTPLMWAVKYRKYAIVELLLQEEDIKPNAVIRDGRVVLSLVAESGDENAVKLLLAHGDIDPDLPDNMGRTPLSFAVSKKCKGVSRLLLDRSDVSPDLPDGDGLTPLMYASMGGQEDLVRLLLQQRDINPDASESNGRSPLSFAASAGDIGVVKLLLERRDVNPDPSDNNGRTPLSYAASGEHEGVVKSFLERRGVNPNSPDCNGRTPLSYAAMGGYEGVVKLLLGHVDINPNWPDSRGRPPLSYAALWGAGGVVKQLLERNDVNPNSADNDGLSPLLYSARGGKEGLLRLLLKHKDTNPDSSDSDGRTPLSFAASRGDEVVVKLLLERGDVNPDSPDKSGRTPLSYAASGEHEGVVKSFLECRNVSPNLSDRNGRTPLSYAASGGYGGVVKLLLGHVDINPNSPDSHGRSPLSYAALCRARGAVKQLLERNDVNPNSPDNDGLTPLLYATRNGEEGLVRLLLEQRGINPDSPDNCGRTPLSFASSRGDEGVVKLLLERRDVNPDSLDSDGRTPLSYAAWRGHESVVKLLLGRRDVNPNSSDNSGLTSLLPPAWGTYDGLVKLLLGPVDADPNSLGNDGPTLLSSASRGDGAVANLPLEHSDVIPNSADSNGQVPLSCATMREQEGAVKLLLESNTSNWKSFKNRDRMSVSVTGEDASHQGVTHPLTVAQVVTLRPTDDPPLGVPISRSVPPVPPQEHPLLLKQSPPDRLFSPLAPSVSTPALTPSFSSPFALLTLSLFAFLFSAFLMYHGCGDSSELFHTIHGAWQ